MMLVAVANGRRELAREEGGGKGRGMCGSAYFHQHGVTATSSSKWMAARSGWQLEVDGS